MEVDKALAGELANGYEQALRSKFITPEMLVRFETGAAANLHSRVQFLLSAAACRVGLRGVPEWKIKIKGFPVVRPDVGFLDKDWNLRGIAEVETTDGLGEGLKKIKQKRECKLYRNCGDFAIFALVFPEKPVTLKKYDKQFFKDLTSNELAVSKGLEAWQNEIKRLSDEGIKVHALRLTENGLFTVER